MKQSFQQLHCDTDLALHELIMEIRKHENETKSKEEPETQLVTEIKSKRLIVPSMFKEMFSNTFNELCICNDMFIFFKRFICLF